MGTIPSPGTVPTAGLIPTTPLSDAGQVIDPSVSVPIANGASRAASAAPEPADEPPAQRSSRYGLRVRPPTQRSSRYGLRVRPPTADHPLVEKGERILAHWLRFVAPRTTRPASRSLDTNGASWGTGRPSSAVDPALPGSPTASILSFTSIGTPCKALRSKPWNLSSSQRFADVIASGASVNTLRSSISLPGASISAMRSINAVTISHDVVSLESRASASSIAVASQSSLLDHAIDPLSTRLRITPDVQRYAVSHTASPPLDPLLRYYSRPMVKLELKSSHELTQWLPSKKDEYIAERVKAGEDPDVAQRMSDSQ